MYMRNVQRNNGKIKGRAKEELENYQEGRKRKKGEIERNGKRMRRNRNTLSNWQSGKAEIERKRRSGEKKYLAKREAKKRC